MNVINRHYDFLCQYGSIAVLQGKGYPYLNHKFGLAIEQETGVIRCINGTTVWKLCIDWLENQSLVAAYSLYLSLTSDYYWVYTSANILDYNEWYKLYGSIVIPYKSPAL